MGRASSSIVGHLLCMKEEVPVMGIHTVAWAVAMAWTPGQDFEGKAWKIGDREVWSRGMWTDKIEGSQRVKISASHVDSNIGKGMEQSRR